MSIEPPQVAAPLKVCKLEIQAANEQRQNIENEVQSIAAKIKEVEQQMARRAALHHERCVEHTRLEEECRQRAQGICGQGMKTRRQPEPVNTRQTAPVGKAEAAGQKQTAATTEARAGAAAAAAAAAEVESSGRRTAPPDGQVGRGSGGSGAGAGATGTEAGATGTEAGAAGAATGGRGRGSEAQWMGGLGSHLHFVERRGQAGAREPRAGRWDAGAGGRGRGEERTGGEGGSKATAADLGAVEGAVAGAVEGGAKRRLEIDDGTFLSQAFFFLDV